MNVGIAAGLFSSLCWALTTVMMRSQSARIDPLSMNAFRSIVAAAFFVCAVFALDKGGAFAAVTRTSFLALCGSLVFGFVLGDTLFFRAMELVGVSTALPIAMTYPLYVLVIAWAFLGEHITLFTVAGTLLVIAGTVSVATSAQVASTKTARERRLGVALAIVAAWCFATSTSILKVGVQDTDVFVAGVIRLGLTSLILLVWRSFMSQSAPFRAYGRRSLLVLSLASLVGTGVGTVTYLTAVQQAGAALAATMATTAPLFATPISVLFLKERLTKRNVLGMVLCVVGVWLVIPK